MANISTSIKIVLLSIFLSCTSCYADEHLKYILHQDDNRVFISIANVSNSDRLAPYNFCLSSTGDLSFEVFDDSGKRLNLVALINDRCNKDERITIKPFSLIGRIYHVDELKFYFGLSNGTYYLTARFCMLSEKCTITNSIILEL